jgi:uncharacterized protein
MKLSLPYEQIAEFCRKWNVTEFALFGSVLRDDFRPDSDVDVLVTFASPELTPSLFEHVNMQDELETIFGRKVDVVSRKAVEQSTNCFRKQTVLGSARTIYPFDGSDILTVPSVEGAQERLDRDPGLLYDMLESARLAREFTLGVPLDAFAHDRMGVSAVSRVLERMGHAAGKVSADVREQHPEIEWSEMAELADRLLGEYWAVNPHEVWTAAHSAAAAIPVLASLIPLDEDEIEGKTQ